MPDQILLDGNVNADCFGIYNLRAINCIPMSSFLTNPLKVDLDAATHNIYNVGKLLVGSSVDDGSGSLLQVKGEVNALSYMVNGVEFASPGGSGKIDLTNISTINGQPLGSGDNDVSQTPWLSDIDGNLHRLLNTGRIGIGTATPAYSLDVNGDCNITGTYRVNGVPLSTGGGGGLQTPWLSDIDGASHTLANVSRIGVNTAIDTNFRVKIQCTTDLGFGVYSNSSTHYAAANFYNDVNSFLSVVLFGSAYGAGLSNTAVLNSSVDIGFATNSVESLHVSSSNNNVGIKQKLPAFSLDITGDCNVTGVYRINGVPLSTGGSQTPWTSDIDAANHSLANAASIGIGASNPSKWPLWVHQGVDQNFIIAPSVPGAPLTLQSTNDAVNLYTPLEFDASLFSFKHGNVGILKDTPSYPLDVTGDCNVTGIYRINGTPLAASNITNAVSTTGSYSDPVWITSLSYSKLTGAPAGGSQTPWTSNIDAAQFTLGNIPTINFSNGSRTASIAINNVDGFVAQCANQILLYSQVQVKTLSPAVQLSTTATSGNAIQIGTSASSNSVVVSSAGSVGIGTASPQSSCGLHIVPPAYPGSPLVIQQKAGAGSNYMTIPFLDPSGTGMWTLSIDPNFNRSNVFQLFDQTGGAGITLLPSAAGGTPPMRMGINATNPSYQLQLGADSAAKPTTSAWTVASDSRLKKDIKPLTGGLDVIKHLHPVEAKYNGLDGTPKDTKVVGFLAQEIQKILPRTVTFHKGKLHKDDKEETDILDFNLHEVLIHLVLAVQQLATQKGN